MTVSRRTFLQTVAAAGLAATPALAIEPIKRTGKSKLTLSLAAYSFNRYLNLKGKTKPQMTLEEFIDLGGTLELPAVELTQYYFPKTSDEYLKEIAARCAKHKLAVSGTAVGNDFCHKDDAKRKAEVETVKRWSEHSAALGAKTMRIFAGRVAKGDSEAEARKRCIDAIHEACDHAAKYKVFLALENHGGITETVDQMLAIVKAVKHDWFGVNLDSGNFRTPDPYGDLEKIAPYAVVAQLKTEISPKGKKKEEADLGRLTKMLRDVGYQGYVALEYEAEEDPKVAVPRYIKELKKLMG
ncbi:MAG TPA: sugar phosphate isomerase/epimerase family protein [Gemmataceae bacterium]|nr:sugar phosphate isomerase/epimerase family protein [Gemmataceae bacterium]